MSAIILKEEVGRLQSFNLPHEQLCETVGECSCSTVVFRTAVKNKRTGELTVKPVQRRVPKSITLLARQESEPLPKAVLDCPEIRSALKAKPRRISWRMAE